MNMSIRRPLILVLFSFAMLLILPLGCKNRENFLYEYEKCNIQLEEGLVSVGLDGTNRYSDNRTYLEGPYTLIVSFESSKPLSGTVLFSNIELISNTNDGELSKPIPPHESDLAIVLGKPFAAFSFRGLNLPFVRQTIRFNLTVNSGNESFEKHIEVELEPRYRHFRSNRIAEGIESV